MKKFLIAVGIVISGLGLAISVPHAFADPMTATAGEIGWSAANGQSQVCSRFEATPTADGFVQLIGDLGDEGWDQMAAARIAGYSVGTYCPDQMDALLAVMQQVG